MSRISDDYSNGEEDPQKQILRPVLINLHPDQKAYSPLAFSIKSRLRTEQEPRVEHGARHHRPAGRGAARGAKPRAEHRARTDEPARQRPKGPSRARNLSRAADGKKRGASVG